MIGSHVMVYPNETGQYILPQDTDASAVQVADILLTRSRQTLTIIYQDSGSEVQTINILLRLERS